MSVDISQCGLCAHSWDRSRQGSPPKSRRVAFLCKQASDPIRVNVVMILADGEFHVGAICDQLGLSQPAVSHHLAFLRHGGIIAARRQGKNNFYGLTAKGLELMGVLKQLSRPLVPANGLVS
jgi:DNA-binding transcriptional ArsR family regulator